MSKYVYHVTFTSKVPKIKKEGLVPFKTSNWVQQGTGERYNKEGGVFAFEHPIDAFKWAFNQNWQFKKPVSIVRIKKSKDWTADPSADIALTTGQGKALVSSAAIKPNLIVDAINFKDFGTPVSQGISQSEWFKNIQKMLEK